MVTSSAPAPGILGGVRATTPGSAAIATVDGEQAAQTKRGPDSGGWMSRRCGAQERAGQAALLAGAAGARRKGALTADRGQATEVVVRPGQRSLTGMASGGCGAVAESW